MLNPLRLEYTVTIAQTCEKVNESIVRIIMFHKYQSGGSAYQSDDFHGTPHIPKRVFISIIQNVIAVIITVPQLFIVDSSILG